MLNTLMQSVGLASVPQAPMHVSSLWVYPVKGCRGCQVSSAKVETTGELILCIVCVYQSLSLEWCSDYAGFPYDRYWMIVTEAEGRFVTQRQDPRLAIIETHLPEAAFTGGLEGKMDPTAFLTLSAPGVESIQVSKF